MVPAPAKKVDLTSAGEGLSICLENKAEDSKVRWMASCIRSLFFSLVHLHFKGQENEHSSVLQNYNGIVEH